MGLGDYLGDIESVVGVATGNPGLVAQGQVTQNGLDNNAKIAKANDKASFIAQKNAKKGAADAANNPPKPPTPAWVLPVSIGGGLLVLLIVILTLRRGKS